MQKWRRFASVLSGVMLGVMVVVHPLAASDLTNIGAMLEANGFAHCDNIARVKSCALSGLLPDGASFIVTILIVQLSGGKNIVISIQPVAATDNEEVRAIYEKIASHLPYDSGTLKDRFPDMQSARLWCQTSPSAIRTAGRCKITEKTGSEERTELTVGSTSDIDRWSLSWSVPDSD
jgi:hypothetical protein